MIHLLQESTIVDWHPELLEQAQSDSFDTDEDEGVWKNIQILSVVLPSILAKMGDYKEAIEIIKQAQTTLKYSPSTTFETQALLNLMLVSFRLHQYH